jgi:hypothetical protein
VDSGCGLALPGIVIYRKTIEQVPGSRLAFVSSVQAGFEFDDDCGHRAYQLLESKWERTIQVSLKGPQFIGEESSDQALGNRPYWEPEERVPSQAVALPANQTETSAGMKTAKEAW